MKDENLKSGKSRSGSLVAIVLALVVLLIAVIVLLVIMLVGKNNREETNQDYQKQGPLGYAANVITTDPQTLQDAVNDMLAKAEEGQMVLEMKTEAYSSDGINFSCYLANATENNYDMFMVFYDDETREEILRTGLIPIGGRIEDFSLSEKLDKGKHTITIVFNQVEEDMTTIHSQVNVGLDLVVY